ncbi:MAG: diguanylate cyclase [Glaciecola sp.]
MSIEASTQQALYVLVTMLKNHLDMDLWMLTRVIENDWIIVATTPNQYGVESGTVLPWNESICCRMAKGLGPNLVPNVNDFAEYSAAPITGKLSINAYVGYPLYDENKTLIGTLCAIDPHTQVPHTLVAENDFINNVVALAENVFIQSYTINRLETAVNKLSAQSDIDDATGLPNQQQFFHLAQTHKAQYDPIGAPIAVMIVEIRGLSISTQGSGLSYDDTMRIVGVDLANHIRQSDVLCKLDGSHFGMLLLNVDTKYVSALVRKIPQLFEKYELKVSIGADVCRQGHSIEASIEKANTNRVI